MAKLLANNFLNLLNEYLKQLQNKAYTKLQYQYRAAIRIDTNRTKQLLRKSQINKLRTITNRQKQINKNKKINNLVKLPGSEEMNIMNMSLKQTTTYYSK